MRSAPTGKVLVKVAHLSGVSRSSAPKTESTLRNDFTQKKASPEGTPSQIEDRITTTAAKGVPEPQLSSVGQNLFNLESHSIESRLSGIISTQKKLLSLELGEDAEQQFKMPMSEKDFDASTRTATTDMPEINDTDKYVKRLRKKMSGKMSELLTSPMVVPENTRLVGIPQFFHDWEKRFETLRSDLERSAASQISELHKASEEKLSELRTSRQYSVQDRVKASRAQRELTAKQETMIRNLLKDMLETISYRERILKYSEARCQLLSDEDRKYRDERLKLLIKDFLDLRKGKHLDIKKAKILLDESIYLRENFGFMPGTKGMVLRQYAENILASAVGTLHIDFVKKNGYAFKNPKDILDKESLNSIRERFDKNASERLHTEGSFYVNPTRDTLQEHIDAMIINEANTFLAGEETAQQDICNLGTISILLNPSSKSSQARVHMAQSGRTRIVNELEYVLEKALGSEDAFKEESLKKILDFEKSVDDSHQEQESQDTKSLETGLKLAVIGEQEIAETKASRLSHESLSFHGETKDDEDEFKTVTYKKKQKSNLFSQAHIDTAIPPRKNPIEIDKNSLRTALMLHNDHLWDERMKERNVSPEEILRVLNHPNRISAFVKSKYIGSVKDVRQGSYAKIGERHILVIHKPEADYGPNLPDVITVIVPDNLRRVRKVLSGAASQFDQVL